MASRTTKGILWMITAQISFVAVWAAVKLVGGRLPLFEVILFRSLLSLIILAPLTYLHEGTLRGSSWQNLFLRGFFGFLAMIFLFYSMIHMNMGNASTLYNTMPIFVAILAPALLGERFNKKRFIFILLSFVGVGMILKPDQNVLNGASVYALLAGLCMAIAMIHIRKLHKTESTLIITLYFTLFCTLGSLPVAVQDFLWPNADEWMWLAFIGIVVTFGQISLTRAFRYGSASTISPLTYVSVMGSYVAGITFFSEVPDMWSAVGACVVIASGVGIMLIAPMKKVGVVPA